MWQGFEGSYKNTGSSIEDRETGGGGGQFDDRRYTERTDSCVHEDEDLGGQETLLYLHIRFI